MNSRDDSEGVDLLDVMAQLAERDPSWAVALRAGRGCMNTEAGSTQTHQLSPDLGTLDIWCNRCGDTVAHDLTVTTDNVVEQRMSGRYVDTARITAISAECGEGHRQTVL